MTHPSTTTATWPIILPHSNTTSAWPSNTPRSLVWTPIGLVQPSYPSISGKPTNLLGHLLEKYQFVEPRHDLIAEALWLLSDPQGYKNKIKSIGTKDAVAKTVRQLKTAQSQKNISSAKRANEEPQRS